MSDPTRWRDGADDLPTDLRASLRGARGPVPPSAADRAAILAAATRIAATPPLAPHASPLHALARVGGWKAVGIVGLLAAGGVALVPVLSHRNAPSAREAHARAAIATRSDALPTAVNPAHVGPAQPSVQMPPLVTPVQAPTLDRVEPAATHATAPRGRAALAAAPAVTATEETTPAASRMCPAAQGASEADVLDAAMQSLGTDPSVTLRCLRDLDAHGGAVTLRDEYWFLGFEASRRLGRSDDARRWGQTLLRGAADSPYAARVRRWIDGTSAP